MTEPEALRQRRQILLEQLSRAADEIMQIDERLSSLLEGRRPGRRWAAMRKGKSRMRARGDILRASAANARRRARKYNKQAYDGHISEGE